MEKKVTQNDFPGRKVTQIAMAVKLGKNSRQGKKKKKGSAVREGKTNMSNNGITGSEKVEHQIRLL